MQFKTIIRAARVPFLALTPICILLGYALAHLSVTTISLTNTLLILVGALAAHIAVNLLNEYQDFTSGLDLTTQKTPFSGGSGALPDDPASAKGVLYATWVSFVVIGVVGIYMLGQLPQNNLLLLAIGGAGLLLIATYTRWINRSPWLCLIAPGLGFGSFMVLGCVLLLANQLTTTAMLLSLVPFFQVNNLLLLNQYPDIEADKQVGRYHILIAYGPAAGSKAYGLFMILPFIIIASLILMGRLPLLSMIALIPIIVGIIIWRALTRLGPDIAHQPQYLAMNVALTLFTPLLLALSILL